MSSKFDHDVKSFRCINYPAAYKCGRICLPSAFLVKYGSKLPNRVVVELPNGALWRCLYDRNNNCIDGLELMFGHYDVKQFYVFVLFYNGGHILHVEIFNVYGVEIGYNVEGPKDQLKTVSKGKVEAVWMNDCYYLSSDIAFDKLWGQFSYNCENNYNGEYELKIEKEHLQAKIYNKVLSRTGCNMLGLDDESTTLEVGFQNLIWKLEMHWINGECFLNKKWCDFAKAGNLCEGDICVFQRTSVKNRLLVAVFQKSCGVKLNITGVKQGKSVMKWLKIINSKTLELWELVIPRLFIEEFGSLLIDNVHLIMPDGHEFCVHYCESTSKLQGLRTALVKYDVKEQYTLFFDYVGRSHFLLSIYNDKGADVFSHLEDKVMLKNIMSETECPMTSYVLHGSKPGMCSSGFLDGESDNHRKLSAFSIEITSKNLSCNAAGVYIGQTLLDLFGKWTTATEITLNFRDKSWLVEADRHVHILCFQKGWVDFTTGNCLRNGQKLDFVHRCDHTFDVYECV